MGQGTHRAVRGQAEQRRNRVTVHMVTAFGRRRGRGRLTVNFDSTNRVRLPIEYHWTSVCQFMRKGSRVVTSSVIDSKELPRAEMGERPARFIENRKELRHARVTPLASIFGSGFLVIVPILHAAVGPYSVVAMAGVCALAYARG